MSQASDPRVHRGMIGEFLAGFIVLVRGFGTWRRHPGLMALGFLPATIVALVLTVVLTLIGINLYGIGHGITRALTHHLDPVWRDIIAVGVGFAVFAAVGVLGAFAFTALSLLLGEPVYSRIWRAVERDLGGDPPAHEPGFWRTVLDSARIVLQSILVSIGVGVVSLVPLVGPPVATVAGMLLSGRVVGLELTARPLEARGLAHADRVWALRSRSPRLIGFGVAVHLCYLVPLGAILVMPAAVAGATALARHAVETQHWRERPSAQIDAQADAQDEKRPVSD